MATGFGFVDHRDGVPRSTNFPQAHTVATLKTEVNDLRQQVERLVLLNQALWELLQERAGLSEAQFLEKIKEVDLRDGTEDGKITDRAVRCPDCQRVCNSRHPKCIYCGTEFETELFRAGGH